MKQKIVKLAMLLVLTITSFFILASCGVDLKEKSKSLYDDMKQIMKETEVAQDYLFTADTASAFSISNNFQDSKAMYVTIQKEYADLAKECGDIKEFESFKKKLKKLSDMRIPSFSISDEGSLIDFVEFTSDFGSLESEAYIEIMDLYFEYM